MSHLISVIVPIYNREKYLRTCLDSIVNQSYKNLEIILVDDGSTDDSVTICEEYATDDLRIKIIRQENQGVAAARNAGLRQAAGQYVGFVDSDDWLDKRAYEILVKNLESTQADVSVGSYVREYRGRSDELSAGEELNTIKCYDSPKDILEQLTDAAGFFNCFIWNKLYKSSVIGEIRFNEKARMSEDYAFNWEVFKNVKKAVFSQFPVYHYRNYNESLTRRCPIENFISAIKLNEKMLKESEAIGGSVYRNILNDYLGLNIRAAELMIYDGFDQKIYNFLKKNLIRYHGGIRAFKLYRRILCGAFFRGFFYYRIVYYLQWPLIQMVRMGKEYRAKKRLYKL